MPPNPPNTIQIYMLVRTTALNKFAPEPEPESRLRSETAPLDPSKIWSAAMPIPPLNVNLYASIPQDTGSSCEIITLSPNRVSDDVLKTMKAKAGEASVAVKHCGQLEISWDEGEECDGQENMGAYASIRVGKIPGMDELEEHHAAWNVAWVDVPTS